MEVSSLWKELTIAIMKPVRQRTGFRLRSSRVADRGFHVSGLREFEIGDSFRSVSRKHFVRTGEEVIIERHPEQNALILYLLDVSASMAVGSARLKVEAGLELFRHLGSACLWQGNKIQVLAFSDKTELESEVITTFAAFEYLLEELAAIVPENKGTDPSGTLDRAFEFAERLNAPADLVCLVSDFLFPQPSEFYRDISILHEITDVIGFLVKDPMEEHGSHHRSCLKVRDAETGDFLWMTGMHAFDIRQKLEQEGLETCLITTIQSEQQWFAALDDFFSTRKEVLYR